MPRRMKGLRFIAPAALLAPTAAWAGPPFLTDDPEPTETHHWEIYGPLFTAEGKGNDVQGTVGAEINYGAAPGVQVTLGLPLAYAHDRDGTRWGAGDLAVSVKYRFYRDDAAGISIAAFPGITLPTASHGMGTGKVSAFLPVWLQKDAGPWSIFGGGGYALNPGEGNRNYWRGGIAVTRQATPALLIGVEVDRQGADAEGGGGSTSLGLGAIYRLKAPFRLLASGGPVFDDGSGAAGFHAFLAVGMDL